MSPQPFAAAILAGGRGTRLGGTDKSTLDIGGRSMLERQLTVLRAVTSHLLIIGGRDEHGIPAVRTVADRVPGAGALGGVYTALMESPLEQVLVVACDMPFLTAPFLAHLAARGADADVALPRDERGRHPLCASYQRRVASSIRARIDAGHLRVGDALEGLDVRELGPADVATFDPDGVLLFNVNTPDDYHRAERIVREGARIA